MKAELKPPAVWLMDWLAKEDDSAFGEAMGADFDNLVEHGFAEIFPKPLLGETVDGYARVRLTDLGHATRALLRAHRLVDWMAGYIGQMAPGSYDDCFTDLNNHFLHMERSRLLPPKKKTDEADTK